MRIAIDLDGTIFSCDSLLYKIGNMMVPLYSQERLRYSQIDTREEIMPSVLASFSKVMNYEHYQEIEDATNTIRKWNEAGNEIVILSSRPNWKALRSMVLTWLDNFDVQFIMLVVACNNKAKFCEKFKIDVLVDDTYSNCKKASKSGVGTIYFQEGATDKDKARLSEERIKVADSWHEIDKHMKKLLEKKKRETIDDLESQ